MANNPLAEVFGFPISNRNKQAERFRSQKLCPFNNKVPSCTKDKANDPLGVCSIIENSEPVITCPIRFREDWIIAGDAAAFFFKPGISWTSIAEVRLTDRTGGPAGNIDLVLVSYDEKGQVTDFGSLEIQAVYISGNVRRPFEEFMSSRQSKKDFIYNGQYPPSADFLSSSRKRLAPQMLYKGGIMKAWKKKQAVALQTSFFQTLPSLKQVAPAKADIAWLLYDLVPDNRLKRLRLRKNSIVYTKFGTALSQITTAQPGDVRKFFGLLQDKLDDKLEGHQPDAPTLTELTLS